ncbi:MAG: cyclase family protein [Clostridiales bacterium]|nr:cyclase family protein [Candidatus Crickella merdequi]
MSNYVEIGYPVYPGMPVYPGLPEVELNLREDLTKGAYWNGSVLSIYLHAGTHVDAPWHYMGGDAPKFDDKEAIPTESFIYDNPLLIDINPVGENYLITIEDLKAAGDALYEADALFFNTGYWQKRDSDFMSYAVGFPAVSPEAAMWIRTELPKVKAVGIDTLSIENVGPDYGVKNGFTTHKAFLNPDLPNHTILIFEDINPEPLIGKKLLRAFTTPLRVRADASNVNIICEVE